MWTLLGTIAILLVLWLLMIFPISRVISLLVVMTDSMQPTLKPGDLLVVSKLDKTSQPNFGDIIVFKHSQLDMLIVHRVIGIKEIQGSLRFYTKGDSAPSIDRSLLTHDQIIGRIRCVLPKIAYPYLWFKTANSTVMSRLSHKMREKYFLKQECLNEKTEGM